MKSNSFINACIACMLTSFSFVSPVFAENKQSTIIIDGKEAAVSGHALPVYLAELSNINDYTLFANAGWDGNWYVGSNVCWIEELPAAPAGAYARAYVGVRLGRAKTRPVNGKPVWEKENIPGEIYVSLASTPAWSAAQKYLVTRSEDIPADGDAENALGNTGESRWFWAEVPLAAVNLTGPNYVAVWSSSEYFVSIASSPVIAGGWGSQKVNSWLNNEIKGQAPANAATSLKTPLSVFEPAIAMKLVPAGSVQDIPVTVTAVKEGRAKSADKVFVAAVDGREIEKTWLEVSSNGGAWKKQGRYVYSTPYMFTLKADDLPSGKASVRCAASDVWGNTGYSRPIEIKITR